MGVKKTILTLLLFLLVATPFVVTAQNKAKTTKITNLTATTFHKEIKNGIVVVDFWAGWCGPCRMLGPVYESVAKEFNGKVKFAKLDVDNARSIATTYKVESIPCIIVFKNGKEVDRAIGYQEKQALINMISKHTAK